MSRSRAARIDGIAPTRLCIGTPGRRRRALRVAALLIAGACAAGTGVGAGVAVADPAAPIALVTVHAPDGTSTTGAVSLSSLQSGAAQCPASSETTMQELGRQGPVTVTLPPSGQQTGTWPLSSILACLPTPVPAATVTGVTVHEADGTPETAPGSPLTTADLATPSDFANSAENPVISDTGSTVQYDRPARSAGDQDFLDEFQSTGPVALDVYEGPPLTVTASVSAPTVPAGTPVTFSAAVTGADAAPLSYVWGFGNSGVAGSTAPAASVTFPAAGTYAVTVLVSDAAGGGGGATVTVTVTGAGTPHGTAPTGPVRGRSHRPGTTARGRPRRRRTGQVSRRRASSRSAGQAAKRSGHPAARRSTPAGTTTAAPPPRATVTAPSSTTTATTTSTATTTTATTATTTTTTAPAPARHRPARPRSPAPRRAPLAPSGGGDLVTGRLIADVTTLPAARSPLTHDQASSPPTPAEPVRASTADSADAGVASGLLALGLLVLGAARELRRRPTRH